MSTPVAPRETGKRKAARGRDSWKANSWPEQLCYSLLPSSPVHSPGQTGLLWV